MIHPLFSRLAIAVGRSEEDLQTAVGRQVVAGDVKLSAFVAQALAQVGGQGTVEHHLVDVEVAGQLLHVAAEAFGQVEVVHRVAAGDLYLGTVVAAEQADALSAIEQHAQAGCVLGNERVAGTCKLRFGQFHAVPIGGQ